MVKDATPESPTAAEGAFRAFIRTFGMLRRFMEPFFSLHGISGSQWGVLRALLRAEKEGLTGLRLTDLGARLLVRPPSVSGVVDRLLRMGLVSRVASSTDLRGKQVSLTEAGRRLVDGAREGHVARIQKVLSVLREEEQEQLQSVLDRIGNHLETLAGGERE
jgi:DNA-binding MarR family transcriptional regulator